MSVLYLILSLSIWPSLPLSSFSPPSFPTTRLPPSLETKSFMPHSPGKKLPSEAIRADRRRPSENPWKGVSRPKREFPRRFWDLELTFASSHF
jgi:hypothetical protein